MNRTGVAEWRRAIAITCPGASRPLRGKWIRRVFVQLLMGSRSARSRPRWLRKFVPEALYLGDQFSLGPSRDKFVKCRGRNRAIDCDLLRISKALSRITFHRATKWFRFLSVNVTSMKRDLKNYPHRVLLFIPNEMLIWFEVAPRSNVQTATFSLEFLYAFFRGVYEFFKISSPYSDWSEKGSSFMANLQAKIQSRFAWY